MPESGFLLAVFVFLLCALAPLSARAAHPLITEDTATQGQGNFQLELTSEHTTLRESGANQPLILTTTAFSHGVVDSVDVILALPHLRLGHSVASGTPGARGLTDLGLDVKWRFYEKEKLSLAFKPGMTFPTGDDTRNLGSGRHTWSAYVTTSYATAPWTWLLHLGHVHHNNTFSERVDIWHVSAAVVRQVGEKLKLILDAGIDTNTDRRAETDPGFLITGLIYTPRRNFDIDVGYKLESTESWRARSLLAGLTLRW
jgi:hypothetical protein